MKELRKEEFESWITFLPDRISDLKKRLPGEVSDKLDFSIASLNVLEEYVLNTYKYEEILQPDNKFFVDQGKL